MAQVNNFQFSHQEATKQVNGRIGIMEWLTTFGVECQRGINKCFHGPPNALLLKFTNYWTKFAQRTINLQYTMLGITKNTSCHRGKYVVFIYVYLSSKFLFILFCMYRIHGL